MNKVEPSALFEKAISQRTAKLRSSKLYVASQQLRSVSLSRPFLVSMGLLAAVAGIYYAVIAAPMYESETRFAIRSKDA